MDIGKIDLSGQVAMVTGGSRGIGREIAMHLARSGARVAVTARNLSKLEAVVQDIEADGGKAMAIEMEMAERESIENAVLEVEKSFGRVDLLVNNAGIGGPMGSFLEADPDEWWEVLEVNLRGVMQCTQAALKGMVDRGSGRIINMGSNAGIAPLPRVSAYSTSKAALLRLGDNLAEEFEQHGIFVFAVSPGLVLTDMTESLKASNTFAPSDWTPIEKVAELSVYLASGNADVLTGRYIHARTDDVEELVRNADKIRKEDRYALRLRT